MKTRLLPAAALVIGLTGTAFGQAALSGTWKGETRAGATLVLTIAVKDSVLTGTLVRNDQSASITEGKATNNTFTFQATLNDQTEKFSGELAGDEIRIWLDRQGPSSAIVLRREKDK